MNQPRGPAGTPQIFLDIDSAMRRGDMPAATVLARRALDSGLSHPVLLNLRAYWHESSGRLPAACADLEAAHLLAPGDARILNALGRCRTGAGQMDAAVKALKSAVALEPGLAGAHYNLGFAHEQRGELDAAWPAYQKAAALDPAMDDAVARLAGLAARRSDRAEARALADRALKLNPASATAAFAHIVADLAEDKFADAERRARAVIDDPLVIEQARAQAKSFLGDALDGMGRFAEAFGYYVKANDALRDQFQEQFEGPGKETGRQLAVRLNTELDSAAATPPSPSGQDGAGLVFLMGFPRAGTTLLGQILASHSRVVTIEEKPLLGEAQAEFINRPGGLARLAALSPPAVEQYRQSYWRRVAAIVPDTRDKVVVDQTPLHTLHLPLIATLFPRARIVFAVRDPRDVVLSCFRRLFAPNAYVYEFLTLEGSARFYDETMRLADKFRARLPLALIEVRNEDVVADFDRQTGALCDFLGLNWEETMRDFASAAKKRRIATPSAMQVTRGIRPDGIGHWKAYVNELAPVLPIVAKWVERFGYA